MDQIAQYAVTIGVPIVIAVGAELVRRSSSIGTVRIDDRSKLTAQLQEALDKERARSERCDDARRKQDRRVAVLEYVVAQVAAESSIVVGIATELAAEVQEQGLLTDARRLVLSATRLKQLARKPTEDDLDETPVQGGIGMKEDG